MSSKQINFLLSLLESFSPSKAAALTSELTGIPKERCIVN